MVFWVCRAGKKGTYHKKFVDDSKIYLAWDGLSTDFLQFKSREELKEYVASECNDTTETAKNTHLAQVENFYLKMEIGDYVITSSCSSGMYSIGVIVGKYEFDKSQEYFHHSRKVNWIIHDVPKNEFSQKLQYTLGAFRTIFTIKDFDEIEKFIIEMKGV